MVKNKLNISGFTLIELLAVITILGILLIAAIPALTKVTENVRKDSFVSTVKNYTGSARTKWIAGDFQCGDEETTPILSTAIDNGTYYIYTKNGEELLEQGGKSSFGNRNIEGFIKVIVSGNGNIKLYPILSDGVHGLNTQGTAKEDSELVRGDLIMDGQDYPKLPAGAKVCGEDWSTALSAPKVDAKNENFINIAKHYEDKAKDMWNTRTCQCIDNSYHFINFDDLGAGSYFILNSIADPEYNPMSPWDNSRSLHGYVKIVIGEDGTTNYYPVVADGTYSLNDPRYPKTSSEFTSDDVKKNAFIDEWIPYDGSLRCCGGWPE